MEQVPPPNRMAIHPLQEDYLTARVPYTPADFERARKAHECHKTQFQPEEMRSLMEFQLKLEAGISYLRPFFTAGRIRKDLFQ